MLNVKSQLKKDLEYLKIIQNNIAALKKTKAVVGNTKFDPAKFFTTEINHAASSIQQIAE